MAAVFVSNHLSVNHFYINDDIRCTECTQYKKEHCPCVFTPEQCSFLFIQPVYILRLILTNNAIALNDQSGQEPVIRRQMYYLSLMAACAAASLAIGTRKGEQET